MFYNPFSSFHDIVADAKKEREQLDQLLTVSTPRERLLVASAALLLSVFGAWLFLGSIAQSVTVEGMLLGPGGGPPGAGRSVEALVWVGSDVAPGIEAGMPAVLELPGAEGGADALDGEVLSVSAVPPPGGTAALEAAAPLSLRRVAVRLDEGVDVQSLAGAECRLVVDVGSRAPITLFRTGRR